MLTIADILRQHEGKTLEFKRDLSSLEKAMRTLVGFANGAGGTLLIGVEDGTRKVVGILDVTKIEEQLANLISDRIEPRLVPEIHVIPWRKTYVLAVEVYPSPSRPHYLKHLGLPAGVYVRIGSTNRQADAATVAELQRVVRGKSFDEEPLPELNSEAIDFRVASECFKPVRTLTRQSLHALQLTTTHQRREVPTVGAEAFCESAIDRSPRFSSGCFRSCHSSWILRCLTVRPQGHSHSSQPT
jgi:ATP-dependent DNA helicase RecG